MSKYICDTCEHEQCHNTEHCEKCGHPVRIKTNADYCAEMAHILVDRMSIEEACDLAVEQVYANLTDDNDCFQRAWEEIYGNNERPQKCNLQCSGIISGHS